MAPWKRQIDLTKLGNQESKNDAKILYILLYIFPVLEGKRRT